MRKFFVFILVISLVLLNISCAMDTNEGTAIIEQYGYSNCIELRNNEARVVLEPNMGGRVIAYELDGRNVLYRDSLQDGVVFEPGKVITHPAGGRFDIGPEKTSPKRPALFFGKWEGTITGDREAEMVSQQDTSSGVMLVRRFRLDDKGSRLTCTQTIKNISSETKRYCYWSRTFAKGGGISLTPLNHDSRFPKGYMIYGPGNVMDFVPAEEPNIRVREGILEIIGPPERPKFVMDVAEGWLAYITRDGQLFIKTFPVYPERVYGEMSGANVSVWYNKEQMCEIEPIGPMETIRPGEEVSFTETWHLFDYEYPEDRLPDLDEVRKIIAGCL
ncbi:MAG: DUF4380 domain-containing protein [Bacteroidales bacterium]|jgi:hypothetical protein|nr:DUF4380 domain-containing protein [Bacteroidales bacterium]